MNLLKKTQKLCEENNIKPARSKGQNFLIKESVYDEIIEASGLTKDDTVLEVGPGLGFLTEKLALGAGKVVAVELDDKLAAVLKRNLKQQKIDNVEIINEDVLDLAKDETKDGGGSKIEDVPRRDESRLYGKGGDFFERFKNQAGEGDYKIAANLPYNITSIFLRRFLSAKVKPKRLVLMLQKEVAERIAAKKGNMSLLSVSVQFFGTAKIISIVRKENFWPSPQVDSAIIEIEVDEKFLDSSLDNAEAREYEKNFFRLVRIGFSGKRKMLKNNLAAGFLISNAEAEEKIVAAGIGATVRAQELSVEDWKRLLEKF